MSINVFKLKNISTVCFNLWNREFLYGAESLRETYIIINTHKNLVIKLQKDLQIVLL